jgi:hypothetical protein
VYIALIQKDLPTLADLDAISHEEDGKKIFRTTVTSELPMLIPFIESVCE